MAREAYVLIIDDDPLIVGVISARLEAAGYNVTTAGDAWQGVIQAHGLKIGLVISDIQMPGVGNGVDGYKQLRAAAPELPVIFISGMQRDAAEQMIPPGDPKVRFIPKPIDFAMLRSTIKELTGVDREI